MFPGIPEKFRVFLRPGPTDLRKSINGLSITVQELMRRDPFVPGLFVFCNRRKNLIKLIYWDRNGFCLWLKRLEEEKFRWPKTPEECLEITGEELMWLMRGFDFRMAHRTLACSNV